MSLVCYDLKLSRANLLCCHGMGDRFANCVTVRLHQEESDFESADGDLWAPCAQDVIRYMSHNTVGSDKFTDVEMVTWNGTKLKKNCESMVRSFIICLERMQALIASSVSTLSRMFSKRSLGSLVSLSVSSSLLAASLL